MVNLSQVRLAYGDRILFTHSDLLIRPGDKIGLVGPNGAGKTSLFRVITGEEAVDDGSVTIDPGVVVGYFSQDVGEMKGRSALEEVMTGAGRVHELAKVLAELEHQMAEGTLDDAGMDRYGEVQTEFLHLDGYEKETQAQTILTGLGIGPDRWDEPVEGFSGGWKMRIALAKILLLNPNVLLIDEPTNHLDIETIVWLEEWLKEFSGALMMTCHDREFMTRICKRTVEVAGQKITTYSGDYDFYLAERVLRREQLIAAKVRQDDMLAKEEEFIARFAARASHAAQVQSRVKMIEKIERIVVPKEPRTVKFEFAPAKRSGDVVVDFKELAKTWTKPDGTPHPVFSGATGTITRGQKVAVTGVNGAGKSTFLKVLTGQTEPTGGACSLGASVQLAYFSQYSSDILKADRTILDEVQERLPQASVGAIKTVLGSFLFTGDDADKRISVLSGGEKSRVMLACLLAQPVNFIVLDEPTNHLDITSREVLLEALQEFDGTVLIVSHDRFFLKHLVNRVIEVDHGALKTYESDYDYYLEKNS